MFVLEINVDKISVTKELLTLDIRHVSLYNLAKKYLTQHNLFKRIKLKHLIGEKFVCYLLY